VNALNLNPLAGLPGSHFVTNVGELLGQLKNPNLVVVDEYFFILDGNLKLWKGLLKS
jgi:hypothetical protein